MARKNGSRVTIAEVAEEAGVSTATVSRTLNNIGVVREDTRQKVLEAVDSLGYSATVTRGHSIRDRNGLIGLVIPDITNPMFNELARAVGEAAKKQEFHVLLTNTYFDPDAAHDSISDLVESRVTGIVLLTSVLDFGVISEVAAQKIPICLLDLNLTGEYMSRIRIDFHNSTVQVLEHLISLNHRRIVYASVKGPLKLTPERNRTFEECREQYDDFIEDAWVVPADYSVEGGEQLIAKLFGGDRTPPTAIWLHGDVTAFGAIRALRKRGLKVPRDVSIVGWGDTTLSRWSDPTITTVSFDHAELGELAISAIQHLLEAKVKAGLSYSLNSQLVIRESTGPAPSE